MTGDLFGRPTYDGDLGQFHTPPWLADRLASMLYMGNQLDAAVLEPCAGAGGLVAAAMRAGFSEIVAMELDGRWEKEFWLNVNAVDPKPLGVTLEICDSLNPVAVEGALIIPSRAAAGYAALSNPPYDDGIDAAHMERDRQVCRSGVALLRTVALHGGDRFARFWRHVEITALEFYVDRVSFDGNTGKIDVCGVAWRRRTKDATDRPTVLHVRGPGR